MEMTYYLDTFQQSAAQLREELSRHGLEVKAGVWLKSVAVKIQKPSWRNQASIPFSDFIFFSTWVNDESLKLGRLNYNIHALKLRELEGYSIKAREFADAFRTKAKAFAEEWPNISFDFGPLTLMEGWVKLDEQHLDDAIRDLAGKFMKLQGIIDDLLAERKKRGK